MKFRTAICYVATMLAIGSLSVAASGQDQNVEVIIGEGGDGKLMPGDLHNPLGIDFDSGGNMFIGELAGGRILRRGTDGQLKVLAGDGSKSYSGDGGPADKATFNGIHNVAVTPGGDIYISDAWNHCVRKIDGQRWTVETFAGTGEAGFGGDNGPAIDASFNYVMCVSFSPDFKELLIADLKNRRVRVVDLGTRIVRTVAGNGQKGVPTDGQSAVESPLVDPRAVAMDRVGNTYILERGGHALRVVRPNGKIFTVAGTGQKGNQDGPALEASFNSPKHLSIDKAGKVYIADDANALIRTYDPAAGLVKSIVGKGTSVRQTLRRPHGVCVSNETLYIVDSGNHRILRLE